MKIITDIIEKGYSETIEYKHPSDGKLVHEWMKRNFNVDKPFPSHRSYKFKTKVVMKEKSNEFNRVIINGFDETGEVSSFTFGNFIWTKEFQKTAESFQDNLITHFFEGNNNSVLHGSGEEKTYYSLS